MMANKELITSIVKLNLRLQCKSQVYTITVLYTCCYIIVDGTITVVEVGANDGKIATDRNNKQTMFKIYMYIVNWLCQENK